VRLPEFARGFPMLVFRAAKRAFRRIACLAFLTIFLLSVAEFYFGILIFLDSGT
jgi:hypothetical protein